MTVGHRDIIESGEIKEWGMGQGKSFVYLSDIWKSFMVLHPVTCVFRSSVSNNDHRLDSENLGSDCRDNSMSLRVLCDEIMSLDKSLSVCGFIL